MMDLLAKSCDFFYVGLGLAVLLTFVRLLIGPTLQDRVMALDLMATLTTGFIVVYAICVHEAVYIGVAIVLALVSFIGTVAYAYYFLERGKP
jgi:multicomponent Na+:H+ antiporter subunit F